MYRPILNKRLSATAFSSYYWLKAELLSFCSAEGLPCSGSKCELIQRIIHYLNTGEIQVLQNKKPQSKFDWKKAPLYRSTVITDNYTNGANVRAFFKREIGAHFRFNVPFIEWMKNNTGKTLEDAIEEWERIYKNKKDPKHSSTIAPQFEYNRYIRDFLNDNPNLKLKDAIKHWKIKRTLKGTNQYSSTDLTFDVTPTMETNAFVVHLTHQ
jgi:hypothetical protein